MAEAIYSPPCRPAVLGEGNWAVARVLMGVANLKGNRAEESGNTSIKTRCNERAKPKTFRFLTMCVQMTALMANHIRYGGEHST